MSESKAPKTIDIALLRARLEVLKSKPKEAVLAALRKVMGGGIDIPAEAIPANASPLERARILRELIRKARKQERAAGGPERPAGRLTVEIRRDPESKPG